MIAEQGLVYDFFEEEYDSEVIDLKEKYGRKKNRAESYEEMAEAVLEAGQEADDPVTIALYGHPVVFVSPSRIIEEKAPERGLETKTYPGISSMDCIYADEMVDPADSGIQMFEATDLLIREWELNPEVPAMIWQIGVIESTVTPANQSNPERFTRIREYLQQFYPEDHKLNLLQTAVHPLQQSKKIEFELQDFEEMHDRINPVQTLYIPPVRERTVQNEELFEQIQSSDHIETITEDEPYKNAPVEQD